MAQLRRIITEEQPKINAVLQAQTQTLPPLARPVAEHVLHAGGKRLRPLLTLMVGRLLGARQQGLYELGVAVEMLHTATLLHDDILDNARTRRNKPTAHTIFGDHYVVLAGDALLAKALHIVAQFEDPRLVTCLADAVMQTAEGELAEFTSLRDTNLTQDEYLSIITGKTAWMLRASCELGALYAGAEQEKVEAAARFGLELGIAFQMVDDALDFSPSEQTGKPFGGDIREGKITPPLLSYLAFLPEDQAAVMGERFRTAALTAEEEVSLAQAIAAGGHADATRTLAGTHLQRAADSLQKLPEGSERSVLEEMVVYVRERKK